MSKSESEFFWLIVCSLVFCQVAEKLHDRASKSEYDKEDFINLANSVEEFTLRFLDPMKYHKDLREEFSTNPQTECILETAIKLEQKKVFVEVSGV